MRPFLLRRRDSNPRPAGYSYPKLSFWTGLSLHPAFVDGGRLREFIGRPPHSLVSAPSELRIGLHSARLRITIAYYALGFPEFTRLSPHCLQWGLPYRQPAALTD